MFTCKRIHNKGVDGRILATGVEWTEHQMWFDALMLLGMFIGFVICAFATLAASMMIMHRGAPWWVAAGIAVASLASLYWLHIAQIPGKPRSLVLHRDGRIEVPSGLLFHPKARFISGTHADVVSFEVRQTASDIEAQHTAYKHGVVIFKRNGDVVYLAGHLLPDHAHKVAVELTHAFAELRDGMASGAGHGDRRSHSWNTADARASCAASID